MSILDWKPRWKIKGTKEPPAFYKDEGRSSLHVTGDGLKLGEEHEVMTVEEHEAFLDRLRKILHDYDSYGKGDIIEMAEVAMVAYGFSQHAAKTSGERVEELEKAIREHQRLMKMRDEGRRISSVVADRNLWEVLEKNRPSPVDLIESELKISDLAKAKKIIFALTTSIRHMARERPVLDECWYAMQYAEDLVPTMVPTIEEINATSAIPIPPWLSESDIKIEFSAPRDSPQLRFTKGSESVIISKVGDPPEWDISGAQLLKLLHLIVPQINPTDDKQE